MSEAHEAIASLALALVVIHIAAAVIMSLLQKENLIRAMVTGKKNGLPEQAIQYPQYFIGLLLLLAWGYGFYMIYSGALPSLTQ
jgi:Mg2+/citrate symporter